MRTLFRGIVAATLVVSASAAFGANRGEQFSISPVIGGYTFEGAKQHLRSSPVYGIRGGYNFTKAFGVEALFDYAHSQSKINKGRANLYRYGGDLLYHFMPDNNLVPYVAAGYAGLEIKGAQINSKIHGAFDYGAGVKLFPTDDFALRLDVRHILYSFNSKTFNNLEYTIGAYIPFGGAKPSVKPVESVREAAAPKAAPAAVVEVAPAPPSPPSSSISVAPASIAAGQTATLTWNSKNTTDCNIQPGIGAVNTSGSMSVTPSSNTAYALTCKGAGGTTTTSSTNIGVTAPPPPKPAPAPAPAAASAQKASAAQRFCNKPAVLAVEFDTNKADIKPKYKADLEKLGEFLKEFPNAKGEISGHTDNVGGKAFNTKLSQRRADSVKQYMEKNLGVSKDRLTAKGFGFAKPVASNKTKQGKAKNRRIETNFTCE